MVLRPDLERLGRFAPIRVRQRFLSGFEAESTGVIMVDEVDAGSLAIRREDGCYWLEHFYLKPKFQGTGIGSAVLKAQLAGLGEAATIRLNVLQGSRARGLYDRFGFIVERQDPIDVFMVRPALGTSDARCGG